MRFRIVLALSTVLFASCGGGGSGGSTTVPPVVGWQSGVFKPASTFQALCVAPRTGIDPSTKAAYPDRAGTLLDENNWLRSWSNDIYLWYSEIVDKDPSTFASTDAYFKVLKTLVKTASNADKDRFHFSYDSATWYALSQNNQSPDYGAQWALVAKTPPREIRVAYTEPGSWPATAAGVNLVRGAQVLMVDGVDFVNDNTQAGVDKINAGIFPATVGETHTFQVLDYNAAASRTITMKSVDVISQPVVYVKTLPTANGTAGYMQFNDHLASSEAALYSAFTTLQKAQVTDLILDIRYNGGGYLDIASEVAYMIAGPSRTAGLTFELQQFNSKNPKTYPGTTQTITPTLFHSTSQGISSTLASGTALPTLDLLKRVFVLTGPGTCSASEAIMNGLKGVGFQVIQIGSTSCGKPYGFFAQDNCSTTYFSIEFQGINAQGQGDYSDGFSPNNAPTTLNNNPNARFPGCSVADDWSRALGDPTEGRLATAISYIASPACPAATGLAKALTLQLGSASDGLAVETPRRQLKILNH